MRLPPARWPILATLLLGLAAHGARADTPPTPTPPTLAAVIPSVAFPNARGTYDLEIRGTGLNTGDLAHAPQLLIAGAPALQLCDAAHKPGTGCVRLAARGPDLVFAGIPACAPAGGICYTGARKLSLLAADGSTSQEVLVAFSSVDPGTPYWATAIVLLVLVVIVGVVLSQGRSRAMVNGTEVPLAKALLLDPETSTYSLSKLQFYAWTAAAVAGYTYLSVARSLVQGAMTFADVPANLPGILLVSVGTGVLATGVSGTTGGKGSGDFEPTASDLITSGGVVAPERLQFLVWTALGVLAFLFYTFSIGPDQITDLPPIPQGFLELMGVSAAGYLGGKLARGPGPKIVRITAQPSGTALALTIDGTALGTKGASYMLADLAPATPADKPVKLTLDPATCVIDSTGFATHIVATAAAVDGITFASRQKLRFTIVNQDGEKAAWEFTTA